MNVQSREFQGTKDGITQSTDLTCTLFHFNYVAAVHSIKYVTVQHSSITGPLMLLLHAS